MASLNKVSLIGNLTRDPVISTSKDGKPFGHISVAVNDVFAKNPDGTNKVDYFDVTVFDRQATACGENLAKGDGVYVEGRITLRDYADKNTGEKRYSLSVTASNVQFLGSKGGKATTASAAPSGKPASNPMAGKGKPDNKTFSPPVNAGDEESIPF